MTNWLKQISKCKQKETESVAVNTYYSCMMTSLEKINAIYDCAKTCFPFNVKELKNKLINEDEFMEVQDAIIDEKYKDLHRILGNILPEVNEETYYKQHLIRQHFVARKGLTMKDMRNIVLWQIWIEHLISHFPNFDDLQENLMTSASDWTTMGDHLYNNCQLADMKPIHLGLYKFKENEPEHPEATKDWATFSNIANPDKRKIWYFKRMMEKAAFRKYDLVTDQHLIGTENEKQFRLPLKLLHTMHFMAYNSTTEAEIKDTMSLLRIINNRNNNAFIGTIQHINYCATHLGNLHSKLLNKHMKAVYDTKEEYKIEFTYPNSDRVHLRKVNPNRNTYILKKMYYNQVLKLVKGIGLNPQWDTTLMESKNPILFNLLKRHFSNEDTYNQQIKPLYETLRKGLVQEDIQMGKSMENYINNPIDLILNFIAWYVVNEIKQYKYFTEDDELAKEFYSKHNGFMEAIIDENNVNPKERSVYYVKEWDIEEIGRNLFVTNENDFSKIDAYLDLFIRDHKILKNPGEEKNNDDDNDDTSNADDRTNVDINDSEDADESIYATESLTLTSAKTVGDISLLLHDTILYLTTAKRDDDVKYVVSGIEKMKTKGSNCKIELSSETNITTRIYYVPEKLQQLIEESI